MNIRKRLADQTEEYSPAEQEKPEGKTAPATAAEYLMDITVPTALTLKNGKGDEVTFCQVFCAVYCGETYCILMPVDKIDGLDDGQAVLFHADSGSKLTAVKDKKLSKVIFDMYYAEFCRLRGGKNA